MTDEPKGPPPEADLPLPEGPKSKYLLFREAVCWIAFGEYDFPAIGPRHYLEFMIGEGVFEEEETRNQGRFDLAQEQLIAAIENGSVKLAGRYENVREKWPSGNTEALRVRMHPISAEAVASDDFYEEDGNYYVAGRWYDRLIVPEQELLATFGGVARNEQGTASKAPVIAISAVSETEAENPHKERRGRPPEWDWDTLKNEIIAFANSPDGLPNKQADLEIWVAEYFQRKHGREPSASAIRSKLSPIYGRLRQKSQ